ncbi:MAG: hypothetical protein M3443_14940 [Actinomycetota bacterium]|nr:hypothetical protein [Actinomycetota bacterium]
MRRSAVLARGGAPAAALRAIEESIDRAWADLCAQHDIAGGADEAALAEIVLQSPAEFEWRVVDTVLDLMSCVDCGLWSRTRCRTSGLRELPGRRRQPLSRSRGRPRMSCGATNTVCGWPPLSRATVTATPRGSAVATNCVFRTSSPGVCRRQLKRKRRRR